MYSSIIATCLTSSSSCLEWQKAVLRRGGWEGWCTKYFLQRYIMNFIQYREIELLLASNMWCTWAGRGIVPPWPTPPVWLQPEVAGWLVWSRPTIDSNNINLKLDSIAASLFVLNWLSWQIVSDDKIQITILMLRRGALSTSSSPPSISTPSTPNSGRQMRWSAPALIFVSCKTGGCSHYGLKWWHLNKNVQKSWQN